MKFAIGEFCSGYDFEYRCFASGFEREELDLGEWFENEITNC